MMDNIFTWVIALVCIVILLASCGPKVFIWAPVILIGGALVIGVWFSLTSSGFKGD